MPAGDSSRKSFCRSNMVSSPEPLTLWRISEFASLDGAGGLQTPGRWHSKGHQIVYAAEHPALALLEALARGRERPRLPPNFQLLRLETEASEFTDWTGDFPPTSASRSWGDAWLERAETLLARVPAAVAPHSYNYLINPAHPDAAAIQVIEAQRWDWDERLAR